MSWFGGEHPRIRWTELKALIHNSNLLTIVFGAVLVFGLPEALLTESETCESARASVRVMGVLFVGLVFGLAASAFLFPLLAPTQFRDFANRSDYLSGKPASKREVYKEVWAKAEIDASREKGLIIGLLIVCVVLFCGFAGSAIHFLVATEGCTPPTSEPTQVHLGITLSSDQPGPPRRC